MWDEKKEELLAKLWKKGLSASQIAQQIGGVSRNAVIGKRIRMGLPDRNSPNLKVKQRKPSSHPRIEARKKLPPPRKAPLPKVFAPEPVETRQRYEELVIPAAERKSIATLEGHHCRWPIGDPQHADFHFCGKDKVAGLPYCEFHARRAYQPPQARRRGTDPVRVSKTEKLDA